MSHINSVIKKAFGVDVSTERNYILISQNGSASKNSALAVMRKLLSTLNKEMLLLLGYTQWYILFEMHADFPLHDISSAMGKVSDISDENDLTFGTHINESLGTEEIQITMLICPLKGYTNEKNG